MSKAVCFAGHRESWHCTNIKNALEHVIEELIMKGYNLFYTGDCGAFDKLCTMIIYKLKIKYPSVKLIKVLAYYHENKEKYNLSKIFDESIFPDIENVYPKAKIIERNKWIVNNSDVLICHIEHTINSGAYKMVKFAQRKNKEIIFV